MNIIPDGDIEFDGGVGEQVGRVGMVTLSTDQTLGFKNVWSMITDNEDDVALEHDLCTVLLPLGVGCFFSRVHMEDTVTPQTLRDMTNRIGESAK